MNQITSKLSLVGILRCLVGILERLVGIFACLVGKMSVLVGITKKSQKAISSFTSFFIIYLQLIPLFYLKYFQKNPNFSELVLVSYITKGVVVLLNTHNLKELMYQHTEPLIRLAYYYVKDLHAAEDIVQEVFIKFYHNQNNYEERGELKAFLTTMTINKSKDYLKSWAYRKVKLQNKLFSPTSKRSTDDELVRKDEQAIIGEAILELPLKQREVLIYFYFNEMSIMEIAHTLSIPEGTVKTRLRRSKELLRGRLKGIEWEALLNE